MTRREKVLALCVGGALGGLALVTLVRWAVLTPFQNVRSQIADEHRRSRNLQTALRQADSVEAQWRELTARTLGVDARDAQRRFQEDMQQLLERHGLRDAKVAPGAITPYKNGSRGIPFTISASGTLKEVVGFLCDFYCRDYLARLDKVRITADQAVISEVNTTRIRPGATARPGRTPPPTSRREPTYGPDGPVLKVSVSAITLVLPELRDLEHAAADKVVELDGGRLQRERAAYTAIFDRNLFMPHRETPRVASVPDQPTKPAPDTEQQPPPPPPPPPPPDGRDQIFVKATASLEGEPVAYVYDEQQRDQPPTKYFLDGPFDEGTLILIHPRGLVVRVGTKDYFYPLGKSFVDREALSPIDHPEVWEALRQESAGPPDRAVTGRSGTSG